jgi:hypothetical protein
VRCSDIRNIDEMRQDENCDWVCDDCWALEEEDDDELDEIFDSEDWT